MKDDGKIHVAIFADDRYALGRDVVRESILRSCRSPYRLVFHCFGEEVGTERLRRDFGEYKGSPMAFARLYLPELLPDVDWCVYADCDLLWFRDVAELWDFRVRSTPSGETPTLWWVRDIPSIRREATRWQRDWNPRFDADRYGCSGLMLMNLRKMRETDLLGRCRAFAREHGIARYVDQDLLNALCNADCGMLPPEWNVIRDAGAHVSPSGLVLHVIGIGQYFARGPGGRLPQFDLWWDFARRWGLTDMDPEGWPPKRLALVWALLAKAWPFVRFLPMPDRLRRTVWFSALRKAALNLI